MSDKLIVAYGDSLTQGYPDDGRGIEHCTPYTDFLQEIINKHVKSSPNPVRILVENRSMYGGQLSSRGLHNNSIDNVLRLAPDMCVVLAGTNDLGGLDVYSGDERARKLDVIVNYLSSIYETLRNAHIAPVAVTVPPLRIPARVIPNEDVEHVKAFHVGVRRDFNKRICDYATGNDIPLADLYVAMANEEGLTRSEYSTPPDSSGRQHDWVHFNRAGYEKMAEVVFRTLLPFVDHWTGRAYQQAML